MWVGQGPPQPDHKLSLLLVDLVISQSLGTEPSLPEQLWYLPLLACLPGIFTPFGVSYMAFSSYLKWACPENVFLVTASEIFVLLHHDTMSLICFVFPHGTCYYLTLCHISIFTLNITIYLFANLFMSVSPTSLCGHKHCLAHPMSRSWNDNRYTVGAKKIFIAWLYEWNEITLNWFSVPSSPLKTGFNNFGKI